MVTSSLMRFNGSKSKRAISELQRLPNAGLLLLCFSRSSKAQRHTTRAWWSLRADEIAVFVVSNEREVDEIHDHHGNNCPENRTDKHDENRGDADVGQPQPPRIF